MLPTCILCLDLLQALVVAGNIEVLLNDRSEVRFPRPDDGAARDVVTFGSKVLSSSRYNRQQELLRKDTRKRTHSGSCKSERVWTSAHKPQLLRRIGSRNEMAWTSYAHL